MANGSMTVSSLPHLVLLRLSRKPNGANSLIAPATASWTLFHMDIAFGNHLSIGGFCYALILVDRATQNNWTFGLKSLRLFHAAAGSLARCFYCDCDTKLFGTTISEYLIHNYSKIVSAPAKCQSTNGLVESH